MSNEKNFGGVFPRGLFPDSEVSSGKPENDGKPLDSETRSLGVMWTAFEIIRRAASEAGKAVTYMDALELIKGQLAMIDEALNAVGANDIPAVTCYTASCNKVPTHRVECLGKPLNYCEDCAKRAAGIGRAMGMPIVPERL